MPRLECRICGNEYYIKPSQLKYGWGKYCSRVCSWKTQFNGKNVKCSTCNKEIYRSKRGLEKSVSGKYFCSKTCQTLWRNSIYIGEAHGNWKSGQAVYRSKLIRSERKMECLLCSLKDKRILTAHHKDRDRSNNNLSNLVWLCLNCHYLVHHDGEFDKKVMEALV